MVCGVCREERNGVWKWGEKELCPGTGCLHLHHGSNCLDPIPGGCGSAGWILQHAWLPDRGLGTRGFGLFSAQPILPQQIYFLVSAPAFLCLELWDGLPAQSGALSAVFPVSSVILLLLSCTGFLICLLFGIWLSLLSFPSPVPCPVSLCSPSARVVSCLVFFLISSPGVSICLCRSSSTKALHGLICFLFPAQT